jgi:hypothetical protein
VPPRATTRLAIGCALAGFWACGRPAKQPSEAERSGSLPLQESPAEPEACRTAFAQLRPADLLLERGPTSCGTEALESWSGASLFVGTPEDWAEMFDADPRTNAWVGRELGRPGSFAELVAARAGQTWAELERARALGKDLVEVRVEASGVSLTALTSQGFEARAGLRPELYPHVRARAVLMALSAVGRPCDVRGEFDSQQELGPGELAWHCLRSADDAPGLVMDLVLLDGRPAFTPQEFARLLARERGQPGEQLQLLFFLERENPRANWAWREPEAFLASAAG